MLDISSDKYNLIIEEVHKSIIGEGSRNAGFNRMMTLSLPAVLKRILGLYLFSFINAG